MYSKHSLKSLSLSSRANISASSLVKARNPLIALRSVKSGKEVGFLEIF